MIVDAEKGLAVISRSVVPFDLGVLSLTFADSVIVPGKVFLSLTFVDLRSSIFIRLWGSRSSHGIQGYSATQKSNPRK